MPRTSPTQAEVASSYTLWCEHFDTLGLDSREDFDAMPFAEKMAMLEFGFGADVNIESAPPMTPERAAEVQTMYARAEAAAAIVKAAKYWATRYTVNDTLDSDTGDLFDAVTRYESLSTEAH